MSDDLNLSGPEKFLKSIGTTLEEVGTWLKGIGLWLIGGSEPTTATEPKPVAEDKGKKKESEENEQEPSETEEQEPKEKIKGEDKGKKAKGEENEQEPKETDEADEQSQAKEKAQAEEKLKAQVAQIRSQAEGDLAAVQKVVEAIAESTLRVPVTEALAKLSTSLESALKLESPAEQSAALSSLLQEIATVKADAEKAAKESVELTVARERVGQVATRVGSDLADVEKVILSIAEEPLRTPEAQQLEGLKKRQEATASKTDPIVQEQEYSTLLAEIGKLKEGAAAAKVKSDETVATRERVAQLQSQAEAALAEAGKLVEAITESTFKVPEAAKLDALKKRQGTANGEIDPAKQEKDFTTLISDIEKFKGEAESAKSKSDEVRVVRERVNVLKKEVETQVGEVKKVVDGIEEVPLREPSAEALAKLSTGLESALKLEKPEEQEAALTELSKGIAPVREAADKAAKASAELVAARQRVKDLSEKAAKDLAALESMVTSTESTTRAKSLKALQEQHVTIGKLTDMGAQEKEFAKLIQDGEALKKDSEALLKRREEYEKGLAAIKTELEAAQTAVKSNTRLSSALVKELNTVHTEMLALAKKRTFTKASGKHGALKKAADAINNAVLQMDAFDKELARIQTDYAAAKSEVDDAEPAPTDAIIGKFNDAETKMNQAILAKDWGKAEEHRKALELASKEVADAILAKASWEKAAAAMDAGWQAAKKMIKNAGVPEPLEIAFNQADNAVDVLYGAREWGAAEGKLPPLIKAGEKILDAVKRGAKYYEEFKKMDAIFKEAQGVEADALPAAVAERFKLARQAALVHVDAENWEEAFKSVPEIKAAAEAMIQEKVNYDACRSDYFAFNTDSDSAELICEGEMIPAPAVALFNKANTEFLQLYGDRKWVEAKKKAADLARETAAILKILVDGEGYFKAFEGISGAYDEAVKVLKDVPGAVTDAVKSKFENARSALKAQVDGQHWGEAIKLLAEMKAAGEKVAEDKAGHDAFYKDYWALGDGLAVTKALVAGGQLPDTVAAAFEQANAAVNVAFSKKTWVTAKDKVADLAKEVEEVQKVILAGQKYYQAFGPITEELVKALDVVKSNKLALTAEALAAFETAKTINRKHVEAQEWDLAHQELPKFKAAVLAVNKAGTEMNAYANKLRSFLDRYYPALRAANKAGLADPEGKAMSEANSAMLKAENAKDWVTALAKCNEVLAAVEAVEIVMQNPSTEAYYKEFTKIAKEFDAAQSATWLGADRLDLLRTRFIDARKVAQDFAKKKDFVKATEALTPLKKAVDALVAEAEEYKKEKVEFDKLFNGITDLAAAQKIAAQPPKKLAGVQVKNFQDLYIAFNDEKNAGKFVEAGGKISGVQGAINTLVSAHATYLSEKSTYEAELKKLGDVPAAREMAASGSSNPTIAAKVGPFDLAQKGVDDAVALEDWTTATGKLTALKDAATELLKAEKTADGTDAPKQGLEWTAKMSDSTLTSRTGAAADPDQVAYIEKLQLAVKNRESAVNDLIAKKLYAKAGVGHAKLLTELSAMEKAKDEYAKYLKKFNAADKGEVETARKLVLVPEKLMKQKKDSLKAMKKRIETLAAKGKLAKAEKEVAAWIAGAKAWKESKAAFDSLNTDTEPNPTKLRDLALLPGGDKVLDALIAGLPEGKPEKFLKAAISARFNISVKRFDKRNADNPMVLPSTELSRNLPDKSLKKMYQLMADLPTGNVKGPVANLIVFDEDGSGASFNRGTKTVKMYCGRANDPNGGKQHFNQPGTILPHGEEVEFDFQAVDNKEVPYFDFATLHEVGHAVESKASSLIAQGGWEKHTSAQVAEKAAAHFKYDLNFVKLTLADKNSKPPTTIPSVPTSSNAPDWEKARNAVVDWCQSVRVSNSLWEKPGVSKQLSIGGRVYQEAYENDWVSYDVAARSKGISSYQFRSSGEWFAELYAAYFSGKLKKTHPYAPELKKLKTT